MQPTTEEHLDKSLRLLKYLREFVQQRTKVVRRIDTYKKQGFVQWFGLMPDSRGCHGPLGSDATGNLWLEVKKQNLPKLPSLPEVLEPWVDRSAIENSDGEEPELHSETFLEQLGTGDHHLDDEEEPVLERHFLSDHPEVLEAWEDYLAEWRPWAIEHSRRSSVQQLYGELFHAFQSQKRLGESYELVVGLGLLTWRNNAGHEIARHVVTAQAELKFDAQRGVVSLECPPPPDGARLTLEDDFLEGTERPQEEQYRFVESQLRDIGDDVWNRSLLLPVLRSWAHSIHPDAEFHEDLHAPAGCSSIPRLSFAPAIILRKRTMRGTLAAYDQIIEKIESTGEVPFGFTRLVDHLEDDQETEAPGGGAGSREGARPFDPQTYFPLPSNSEQDKILDELRRRRGVLVQGPPGTGKSHTIANLVCHFLANGKRVLITSETPRALRVLKEKIPKEIRPLCVSLLGADTASFSELESSISGISQRHSDWEPASYDGRITHIEDALEKERRSKIKKERELREIRESELHPVTIDGGDYRGTAAAIAQTVQRERETFGWLSIPIEGGPRPPMSSEEARFLLESLRQLTDERRTELQLARIQIEDLPTPEELARYIAAEEEAARRADDFEDVSSIDSFKSFLDAEEGTRTNIHTALETFTVKSSELRSRPETWIASALGDVLSERESVWELLADRTREGLKQMETLAPRADHTQVRLPPDLSRRKILDDASELVDHLKRGGSWGIVGVFHSAVRGKRYLRKRVTVDGKPVDNLERLGKLVTALRARETLDSVWKRWQTHAEAKSSSFDTQAAELKEHLEALDHCFELLELTRSIRNQLRTLSPPVTVSSWLSEEPQQLLRVIEAVEARQASDEAQKRTSAVLEQLETLSVAHNSHPVNQELRDALEARDQTGWSRGYKDLGNLQIDKDREERSGQLIAALRSAAPEFATDLEESHTDDAWDSRLQKFDDAWHWAFADNWLAKRDDPSYYRRLDEEIHRGGKKIGLLTAELAAERAWREFLSRLTQKESESLQAWQVAVRGIGKGTGKTAEKYRQEARKYMAGCVDAIPAWIVPRYRIADVLDPEPELFDVVIVDEASQTGIDGLFLYYLGRQTIVVGDHQQISPYGVGYADTAVSDLQRRFLDGIPFHAALEPKSSLYDHATIRFRGKIALREHFRCMPEIIQFSNDLAYAPNGTPLIPLRSYPPDRLQPVLTEFVEDGYQKGSASTALNKPEAERLVKQLVACLGDPRYDGKTFGVISLLGDNQARYIQSLLAKVVSPEDMETREITCGDAYAFQGDERDVTFLSMVSAPNARIGALAGEPAKRRFNVAASRARDQVWLFHSAKLEDLSAGCMRRRLLDYCLSPRRIESETTGEDNFESGFERDVCKLIRDRGFFVRVQVPAGEQASHRYRIDLVVEGIEGRLAVECDGDQWHGPESYEKDMDRQRQLERAGWMFFRLRASTFYRDPNRSLIPLWEELDRLGIRSGQDSTEPLQSSHRTPLHTAKPQTGAPVAGASRSSLGTTTIENPTGHQEGTDASRIAPPAPAGRGRSTSAPRAELAPQADQLSLLNATDQQGLEDEPGRGANDGALVPTATILRYPTNAGASSPTEEPLDSAAQQGFDPEGQTTRTDTTQKSGGRAAGRGEPRKRRRSRQAKRRSRPTSGDEVSIGSIPQHRVQQAILENVPREGRIPRSKLLRLARRDLGFARLGRRINARLSRCLGGFVRSGRLKTDGSKIWRDD